MRARGFARMLTNSYIAAERETARQNKIRDRNNNLSYAEQKCYEFENKMHRITNLHLLSIERPNWLNGNQKAIPEEPIQTNYYTNNATDRLLSYSPTFIDHILFRVKKKRDQLEIDLYNAKRNDKYDYEERIEKWKVELSKIKIMNEINKALSSNDQSVFQRITDEVIVPNKSNLSGEFIKCVFEKDTAIIHFKALEFIQVIPSKHPVLLKRQATTEDRPISNRKRQEYYFNYILSASLYNAMLFFEYFDFERVIMNAHTNLLNPSTGKYESCRILQVDYEAETFSNSNIDYITLRDFISMFPHKYSFSPSKGFAIIENFTFK